MFAGLKTSFRFSALESRLRLTTRFVEHKVSTGNRRNGLLQIPPFPSKGLELSYHFKRLPSAQIMPLFYARLLLHSLAR